MNAWQGDQAAGLRRLFGGRGPQVVAFASGREACGRTTLIVQSAVALAASGHAVVIVDENPGPSNAVSAFGLAPRGDLAHAVTGDRSLRQVMLPAAPLVHIVPASQAARDFDHLTLAGRQRLVSCLGEISRDAAFVLIDCATRRGGHLSPLALAARHMAVVVAAQGSAITHAYALMKRLSQERGRGDFHIAITRARGDVEARAIFDNMRRVAKDHLDARMAFLGASKVPVTDHLADALLSRLPMPVDDEGDGWNPSASLLSAGWTPSSQGVMMAHDSVV